MTTSSTVGKQRRLRRLFPSGTGRILIVPLDDSLLAGPMLGLEKLDEKLRRILAGAPDAIVGFRGLFLNHCRRDWWHRGHFEPYGEFHPLDAYAQGEVRIG